MCKSVSTIFKDIKDFTVESCAVSEEEVTEDSLIEDDLGIYGDDAIEYIVAFGKKFNVDVSNFMAADYFSSEGVMRFIVLLVGLKDADRKQLRISHLIKAVIAGRLDEEVIKS